MSVIVAVPLLILHGVKFSNISPISLRLASPPHRKKRKKFPTSIILAIPFTPTHSGRALTTVFSPPTKWCASDRTQIGLTATPKETKEVSNIDYFGDPIYTYSLRQGIDDGFLAPYKVVRIRSDSDWPHRHTERNERSFQHRLFWRSHLHLLTQAGH